MSVSERGIHWPTILAAGGIAGLVDVVMASIINRVNPVIVLQAIASGILGKQAFAAGAAGAAAGLLAQLIMSVLIAAIFFGARGYLGPVQRHTYTAGALYGIPVYVVMTWVVVPLSRAKPHFPNSLGQALPDILAMILFGLIIGAMAALDRHWRRRP